MSNNLELNKSDQSKLRVALAKAEADLTELRSQNNADESGRIHKISIQSAVVRSFRRLLNISETAEA